MFDAETCHQCERTEAEGFFSLMRDIDEGVKASLSIRTTRIAGAPAWSCPVIPWMLFNRTIGLGLFEQVAPGDLEDIARFYGGIKHAVEQSPYANGIDEEDLSRRGYTVEVRRPKFVRSSEPKQTSVDVEVRVAEPMEAEEFARVMTTSFGMPPEAVPWVESVVATSSPGRTCVIARIGGVPAGTGFLFCKDGVGWLGGGCCLPEFRGRGVQRALIEGRSSIARDSNCDIVTSETNPETPDKPNQSYRNMVRCRFEMLYARSQWTRA